LGAGDRIRRREKEKREAREKTPESGTGLGANLEFWGKYQGCWGGSIGNEAGREIKF